MAIIGIDLGTTNSLAVAYMDDHFEMIPNSFHEYITPSVVSVDEDGRILVGKIARQRQITHPNDTASLFKRSMGKEQPCFTLRGRKYLAEELSAFVVRQLVEDAKAFLHEEIEEIVISVPAYFNEYQRSATKRIGELLGIKVERLINEPSAAAIACHYGHIEDETFIVFDFGGGTLDVSVVDCFDNVISICAIAGDNHLGGSDFDHLIANEFCQENNLNFDELPTFNKESLLLQCEKAKQRLPERGKTTLHFRMDEKDYEYELCEDRLMEISKDLFTRMRHVIAKAVTNSGFEKDEIHKLILVGGSCHMPLVRNYLYDLMSIQVMEEDDLDSIVVMGLGTYIGIKQRKEAVKQLVLTDICPFSLGIAVHNESDPAKPLVSIQIPRNTVLPASNTQRYYPVNPQSRVINMDIYQGEEIYAIDNIKLSSFTIALPKNNTDGVDVTFSYDINSLLCVETCVVSTGHKEAHYLERKGVAKVNAQKIKSAALNLSQKPAIDYITEQTSRIISESSPLQAEAIKKSYIEFEVLLKKYENNLRKHALTIARMQEYLDALESQGDHCDVFNMEEDDDDTSSSGGYLS